MGHQSFINVAVLPIPNLVFYPNTSLPLYIIDPRHVKMVHDCIATCRLLAVSLMDTKGSIGSGKSSPRVICTAGTPQIMETMEDGSVKVLLVGESRIKLISLKQSLPYTIYSAEEIPDIYEDSDLHEDFGITRLLVILKKWAKENIEDSNERERFISSACNPKNIVDAVSMYMIADSEIRQLLLENVHLIERIQMLTSLFKNNVHIEDAKTAEAIKFYEKMDLTDLDRKIAH
ncbi:MAG: hypothetical protein COW01_13140 [Bdellovibrionales bacterium CG12_big_fil_rev_8_21_14_0_65_38_15]|nr:MAG: hypothetical protein COW79_06090 [Bdellovibrionales bacterium CG22_combo_CG10-13_8_21_14_all_38_13]PIQ53567.1 MAG: hypothetical protein COW01_13140 [Bdellovibrionales bacterium CG12_big_fil_rev_8_21_14_0_65_38_15]PIR28429.1 MAG: hypothetical protein COV38_15500 [Bdellovibrionales bacterium CG11_big_fil_rev_8_21_14_0_20_38_13]